MKSFHLLMDVVDRARSHRIVAILAGGESRRMSGIDKATFVVDGRRLVDLVCDRVKPQADQILLSAKDDYGIELEVVRDHPNGLEGPVAGLWAIASWIEMFSQTTEGFFTVPVDAPSISLDLFDCLEELGGSAIAYTASGLHPTFGYWEIKPLLKVLGKVPAGSTISLKAVARSLGARLIAFDNENGFANINSIQDAEAFKLND